MFPLIKTATILFGLLTILTGVIYPVAVTVVAQVLFPKAANGSLLPTVHRAEGASPQTGRDANGVTSQTPRYIGSELMGQAFTDPKYFWGRPSATSPVAYHGLGGSGSNLAPTNPALVDAVRDRVAKLREADPDNQAAIPVDLVTASASGLDPHISPAAAFYQVHRVAMARGFDIERVGELVSNHVENPTLGVFGQSRVNVLKLNLALDLEKIAVEKK